MDDGGSIEEERARLGPHLQALGLDPASLRPLIYHDHLLVCGIWLPGARAPHVWHVLRAHLPQAVGRWPIILGSEDDLREHRLASGLITHRQTIEGICTTGDRLYAALCRTEGFGLLDLEPAPSPPSPTEEPHPLPRPAVVPLPSQLSWQLTQDLVFGAGRSVALGLLPCAHPWQVPALLNFGNYNHCPVPARQVAMLRYWHRRHGAEPICLGADRMELLVERPPASWRQAFALAQQQFEFCKDIVAQGLGNLRHLAGSLRGNHHWTFWWE